MAFVTPHRLKGIKTMPCIPLLLLWLTIYIDWQVSGTAGNHLPSHYPMHTSLCVLMRVAHMFPSLCVMYNLTTRPGFSSPVVPAQLSLYLPLCASIALFTFFLFFFKDLFYVYKYTVAVFRHTRRGHQIPLQMVVSHHVVAGNWTQDLWKSSQCS